MKKIGLNIFRVILLTTMLLNSLLASAAMPCKMDMPNGNSSLLSNNVLDHSQHSMTDSDMATMDMAVTDMAVTDMAVTDMSDTSIDCCGNECPCEMSCSAKIVLLNTEPNVAELTSADPIGFYLSSIPNAVQGNIFHPPIQA